MQLEDRISPAVYGTLDTIDNNLSISSLAASDVVLVEIASADSVDTFNLNDGQLAGDLKLSFLDDYTPTVGDTFTVLTGTSDLAGNFTYEGLGFYDGLYFAPVISGDTLSLEVRSVNHLDTLSALGSLAGTFTFTVEPSGTELTVTAEDVSINLASLVSVSSG